VAGAAGGGLTLVTGALSSVTRTCAETLARRDLLECEKKSADVGRAAGTRLARRAADARMSAVPRALRMSLIIADRYERFSFTIA
jgi:hypothetical protein